jgi:signal transduction histidine kinase
MKPGKLYLKIFLSFILILIITEILVFGLFAFSARSNFRSRIRQYASSHAILVKELIEDRIKSEAKTSLVENQSLRDLIIRLSDAYGAKIWLAGTDGKALLKSFQGSIPEEVTVDPKIQGKDLDSLQLHHHLKKRWALYAKIPIEIDKDRVGSLHVLFEKMQPAHSEGRFALGLLGIGIVIALLTIPVSRLITERVKRLRHSALQIADGDLSHRVSIKGSDEIGELGRSFNRMADKLEKMIRGGRELTANISHELRSPLARIRIAEELIRDKWEQGDFKDIDKHLDTIREDIEELDRLITSILTLSKLDLHQGSLKLEPINPADLIEELLARFNPAADRKGLHLVTDLSFDSRILGDQDALRTALSNLVDNAVKFTPHNGTVIVKVLPKDDSVNIKITNSFEALSEKDLTKIFEPFYIIDGSGASGSGLGLAITRKIIEQHGGTIVATNSAQGLEIQVQLPEGPSG